MKTATKPTNYRKFGKELPPRWTKEEKERLETLAGNYTLPFIARRYNRWAGAKGYPLRSRNAIRHRMKKDGESTVPVGVWIRVTEIARILEISCRTIRYWVDKKMFDTRKFTPALRSPTYVMRSDFVAFARENPQRLAGCSFENLLAILEDEDLARHISSNYKIRSNTKTRVRCVETGKVYDCVKDASIANFICTVRISYAVKHGGTAAGYHWEALR
jgi:hypothetical protein